MKLAMLGCGVVGGGLLELLQGRKDLELNYVLVRGPHPELGALAVTEIAPILRDPEVSLVVEVMGGVEPAFSYVSAALAAGKHVVTSNKALIAARYDALSALAWEHGVSLRCAGAVGGGIPFLSALEQVRRRDRLLSVSGILNGTTNYILDIMTREGRGFETALTAAQALGYAESDPTADIDGWDIRRKLVICANIAFDVSLREERIPMAGIRRITAADIAAFTAAGFVCRMIASASRKSGAVFACLEPTLVPCGAPEAAVSLNCNRITLLAEKLGAQSFCGQGAGRFPTASNVLQDCLDILDGSRGFYTRNAAPCAVDNSGVRRRYYVRTAHQERYDGMIAGAMGPGLITRPIPVSEIHMLRDDSRFLAALPDNYEVTAC
ncbi:MAG: homoserine dehydrogenase [Oscillospiraceae bacterium]|nr:homoserine dehydrogenase [Oscillospiraceae bacterium]